MKNNKNEFAAVILAAGVGKRMNSQKSKVLHHIAGKPMIQRTIEMLQKLNPSQIIVVVNLTNAQAIRKISKKIEVVVQETQLGTADAAKIGLSAVGSLTKNIAMLYGDDTAFYSPQTVQNVYNLHQKSAAQITFVTIIKENPHGLGRIVRTNGKLVGIIEEKDATGSQRKIKEINDGLYFFKKVYLAQNILKLTPSTVTGELYITDIIEIALKNKKKVETYTLEDQNEWHGVNTQIELAKANLKLNKSIHIMGACGAGAAAVAGISSSAGYKVSGCDTNTHSTYTSGLKFKIQPNHSPSHLKDISCLITSPAVLKFDPKNKEIAKAKQNMIPVLTWQEFQGAVLQENKFVIAVAGSYGKSTTTAMIAKILIDQKLDPTVEIGAKVLAWNQNFRFGNSNYYVCEADEYNNNFLNYCPDIAIVLNTAWDHPDFFKNQKEVLNSYKKLIRNIKHGGTLIIGSDPKLKASVIGSDPKLNIIKIENFKIPKLTIIGNFRKENASAALTLAKTLGLDIKKATKSVSQFSGLGRRLEFKGEMNRVKFYDDYAVQPYTILKTTNALHEKYKGKKILLVLEPHTFSRVNKFLKKFVQNLKSIKVNQILVTDVFPAREKGDSSLLSKRLAKLVGPKAIWSGSIDETAAYVKDHADTFDVVCTMGAGNIYKLFDLIKNG